MTEDYWEASAGLCDVRKANNKQQTNFIASEMKLAVRTTKADEIKCQILNSLELGAEGIVSKQTNYNGITLLEVNESAVTTSNSIRNIEALLLDEVAAADLHHPSAASDALSFKSLDGVDEREQYEHLSQLLHILYTTRDKR